MLPLLFVAQAAAHLAAGAAPPSKLPTPNDIVASSPAIAWKDIPADDLMVIDLKNGGRVVVQLAPAARITEYTAAQSLLMGIRGTLAPFAASALLAGFEPRIVLLIGLAFMVTGTVFLAGVVREPRATPVVVPA